jgi:hypothetical protein
MPNANSDPRFEARPSDQIGQGWCVHVFWPSKKTDIVTGFLNQYEALNWIKFTSKNWVVDKIMRDQN